MLILTEKGLYCRAGNFYIDPSRGVENAIITHAHADHARRGSQMYFCESTGVELLRERIGKKISVTSFKYGEAFELNGVKISFHSAGHILGSSQVRLEYQGEVWVASGDYKRDDDPTCEPFEVVPCDVFVTEATFGAPSFKWGKKLDLGRQIFEWWQKNRGQGINSVLFAYSLGKAQRVLGVLEPFTESSVYCHSAVTKLNHCYRQQGIQLAETICLSEIEDGVELSGELVLVPPSFLQSPQASILGQRFETAFASGWMAGNGFRGRSYDKGFVMSDHADWNDLVQTIQETKAHTVYVQHRGHGALVRHLRSLGLKAFPDTDLVPRDASQLSFF